MRGRNRCRNRRRPSGGNGDARTDRRAQLRAHPRARRSRHLHQPARGGRRARRGARACRVGRAEPAALRRAVRGQGQHRRRRPADHRGLPGLRLSAGAATRPRSRGCASAGAIVIGKTNLDQFATGLVGVRSPYGVPRNAVRPGAHPRRLELRLGGRGRAPGSCRFALGTDTAGSGRVPAAFNNIVGLKPSLGLVSTAGVVPACRSLDCVSMFALTVDDAWTGARGDGRAATPTIPIRATARSAALGAMPPASADRRADAASGCSSATALSAAAYDDAVAERLPLGADDRRDRHRAVLRDRAAALRRPVGGGALPRRSLAFGVGPGRDPSGHPRDHPATGRGRARSTPSRPSTSWKSCAGRQRYVPEYRRAGAADGADGLHGRAGAGRSDPAQQPARHLHQFRQPARSVRARGAGRRCARRHCRSASRCSRRAARRPARLDRPRLPCRHELPLGALGCRSRRSPPLPPAPQRGEIAIAVVGAHLSGMPLNGELRALGGRLLEATTTAPTTGSLRSPAAIRRSRACCASDDGKGSGDRGRRSGRCRAEGFGRFVAERAAAAVDRHASARRRPDASRASWSRPMRRGRRATFPASAAGAPFWRRASAGVAHSLIPSASGESGILARALSCYSRPACGRRGVAYESDRLDVMLVFLAHRENVRAHRRRCGARGRRAGSPPPPRSCSSMRFREPPQIAELGAAERLHARPRRQRQLGEIAVVRAGVDRARETPR